MQIGDGINDGKFTIKKNQGLSQAIAEELGLDKEQTKKLGKSIWTKIFDEIKEENKTHRLFKGGDCFDCGRDNFRVFEGQEITISENRWAKINEYVNEKVNTKEIIKQTKQPASSVTNPAKTTKPENTTKTAPQKTASKVATADKAQKVDSQPIKADKLRTDIYNSYETDAKKSIENIMTNLPTQKFVFSTSKTESVKELLWQNISPETAAHIMNNCPDLIDKVLEFGEFRGGLKPEDIRDKILIPLATRFDALGIKYKDGKSGLEHVKNLKNSEVIKKFIKQMTRHILNQEKQGNLPEAKIFEKSYDFLNTVANMEKKPEIKGDAITKKIEIDGKYITIRYNNTTKYKQIEEIRISYNPEKVTSKSGQKYDPQELYFTKYFAAYGSATDQPNGRITSGYDYNELCRLVKKIFESEKKKY